MPQNYVPQQATSNAVLTIYVAPYDDDWTDPTDALPLLKCTPVDMAEFENFGTQREKDANGLSWKAEMKTTSGFAVDIETKRFGTGTQPTLTEIAAIGTITAAGYTGRKDNLVMVLAQVPGDAAPVNRYMSVRNFVPFGDDVQKSAAFKCRLQQDGPEVVVSV